MGWLFRHRMPLACLLLAATTTGAGELERAVDDRLEGAWAVAGVELVSGCGGFYTDNRVRDHGVSASADHRLPAGEVVHVDKVKVKRSRVDLLLSVDEPILVARQDGPFELFDEARCQVQLIVDLPREVIRSNDVGAVMAAVLEVLTPFGSRAEALASEAANGRQRRAFPPDYEVTLARHAAWQAERLNAAVAERAAAASDDAVRLTERIRRDPAYLDGFAAGVEAMRDWRERACDRLVDVPFGSVERDPPSGRVRDRSDEDDWRAGYRDGQELVFSLQLAQRLQGCFVPVPEAP